MIRAASGRANVFIHCGAMTQKETENLVKHAYEAGADGVGVVTPMFLGVTDKEMTAYYNHDKPEIEISALRKVSFLSVV